MKKAISIMMVVAVLLGCSGVKQVTTIGRTNTIGTTACEVEIMSKGDEVSKEKIIISMDLTALGVTEEQAKESMSLAAEQFNGIDGYSYKVETNSTKVIITTEIDYSKADLTELKQQGLIDSSSDAKYVSLKMSKANHEKLYGVVFE